MYYSDESGGDLDIVDRIREELGRWAEQIDLQPTFILIGKVQRYQMVKAIQLKKVSSPDLEIEQHGPQLRLQGMHLFGLPVLVVNHRNFLRIVH